MSTPPTFETRILIIEDEAVNVALLTKMLSIGGYEQVEVVTNPFEALDRFVSFAPDLVLLDLHMPGMSGFDVLTALQGAQSPDDYLPIVVLTADAEHGARRQALSAGAHDFLTKPYEGAELLLRIANLVHARRLHVVLRQENSDLARRLAEATRVEHELAIWRAAIVERTRLVLGGSGLGIVLQPIIDLESREEVGAEALSRFVVDPPSRPDLWFQEAAQVGLGVALEVAAIRLALEALPTVPGSQFLSINASAETILSNEFSALVDEHPAERIVIELTEHELVPDYPALHDALAPLRERGVRLAADDTGTGYSGLEHILRLRPDIIKLDRFLVAGIDQNPVSRALVTALVTFASDTGSALIAEGVETTAELETLSELGVDLGQGYLLARPAPPRLPPSPS